MGIDYVIVSISESYSLAVAGFVISGLGMDSFYQTRIYDMSL